MVVVAGFALILTAEVAMPILQVNKLRPNEAGGEEERGLEAGWEAHSQPG